MNQLDQLTQKIKELSPHAIDKIIDYVDFLVWQEQQAQQQTGMIRWSFDLIEHFSEAEIRPKTAKDQGAEIKIGVAASDGLEKPAIFAHPPVQGRSTIEYYVPIPQDIDQFKLSFATGIRDGSKLSGANLVAFSIHLNGYRIWGTQTNSRRWQNHSLDLTVQAGDINQITFATEALGNHRWTWAAWGSPIIEGKSRQ
ncbi:MAG: hypothetical protein AAF629_29200 [Chloroflexota bacterium]